MGRLTITLPDDLHRALKEAAARRGHTIGDLIAESLQLYGVKDVRSVKTLVARARQRSELSEREAVELAVAETRRARA